MEGWNGSYIPFLLNDILTGYPHSIASCPTALPSHLPQPKIQISPPSCPKNLSHPVSSPVWVCPIQARSPQLLQPPFRPPPPAHFPFSPQTEQMKNVLWQEGRGKHGGGGKKPRHMSALCLHLEKCKTPLPQTSMEISLALDTKEGDLLARMKENRGGRRSDPRCLQKGHPVPAARTGHAARLINVPALE